MRTRLQRIEVNNFKAFRKFDLDVDGKHLLVYGPNGSGKSSLYWALHCFLQSSRKSTPEVVKYFDDADPQNLLNIHEDATVTPGEISLTLRDMTSSSDTIYRISLSDHETRLEPVIRMGDLASDFITYRFFFGFSHFRNSDSFNLWPLFEKEILPFCVSTGSDNPLDCWRAINDNIANPFHLPGGAGNYYYRIYRQSLARFRALLPSIVSSIGREAQSFYDRFFAADDIDSITLGLQLVQNATYPSTNWVMNKLSPPVIELVIQINGMRITRPQTFLNEAKLTQLALSVRFAASLVNLHQSDLKLLVLDDLLVSLDMSNRMRVVDILVSETFADYQKIMLTHDLGLFEEMKRRIGSMHSDWLFCRMHTNPLTGPNLVDSKSDLEMAQHYLDNDQLAECGNRLRKSVESNLEAFLVKARENNGLDSTYDNKQFSTLAAKIAEAKSILETAEASKFANLLQTAFTDDELKMLLNPDGIDHTKLTVLDPKKKGQVVAKLIAARTDLQDTIINSLTTASRKRQTALKLLAQVSQIKDRILNPASHAGVTPIYTKEAEDAVKVIRSLEVALQAALASL